MIKEQLTLPLWEIKYINMCTETGSSGTFTFAHAYSIWPSRDDILRDNVKRIWAIVALIMMFAVPTIGIRLLS